MIKSSNHLIEKITKEAIGDFLAKEMPELLQLPDNSFPRYHSS
jgi:hypothetical protein